VKQNSLPIVAIVILNWNGKEHLETFLASVINTQYTNAKVYVIDNGSDDGSIAFMDSKFPSVSIIALEKNLGFPGGYNAGLKDIEADYFVLLNNDVEVKPDWIDSCVELLESDHTIAACQPKILAYSEKEYFEYAGAAGGYIDWLGYPFCKGRLFENRELDKGQYDKVSEIFWASGAALFIRAELYHRFEGLEESFFAHMEEIDLCWRLKNAGYKIYYNPASIVYHLGGGSIPYGSTRKTFLNFRNNLIMLYKNLTLSEILYIMPIRFLLDSAAAFHALLKGQFQTSATIVKAQFSFLLSLADYIRLRRKSQRIVQKNKIADPNLSGIYRRSIVFAHFLRDKNKYSEL